MNISDMPQAHNMILQPSGEYGVPGADLHALGNMEPRPVVMSFFYRRVFERGYRFFASDNTRMHASSTSFFAGLTAAGITVAPSAELIGSGPDAAVLVIELEDSLVLIGFWGIESEPKVWWQIAADSIEVAVALSATLKAAYPLIEPGDDNTIAVTFWSLGSNAPVSIQRGLAAPARDIIETNYPAAVREALRSLVGVQDSETAVGGRLILLSGKPGSGKTTFLRHLGREWKSWCKIHYINDPEQFLGHAQYMTDVLMEDEAESYTPSAGRLGKGKWKLIIMEDADEFLSVDAKDRSGQALQRLLNLGDGFLGQGARSLILLTTNEPIQKIHPAIIRPGRNMADIEFLPFNRDEANQWLARHGSPERVSANETTLAELYEMLAHNKVTNKVERKGLGFVP